MACPSVVGRDTEWAQLEGALADIVDGGPGRLVSLQGEAGIGKTRLATESGAAARTRNVRVLAG